MDDEHDASEPLMSKEEKAKSTEAADDGSWSIDESLDSPYEHSTKLKKQKTIGDIEVDANDMSLSNMADSYPRLNVDVSETNKRASVGDTSISDLLEEQSSLSDMSGTVPGELDSKDESSAGR